MNNDGLQVLIGSNILSSSQVSRRSEHLSRRRRRLFVVVGNQTKAKIGLAWIFFSFRERQKGLFFSKERRGTKLPHQLLLHHVTIFLLLARDERERLPPVLSIDLLWVGQLAKLWSDAKRQAPR